MNVTEIELIERVKNGDPKAAKEMYLVLRPIFFSYFKKHPLQEDTLKDLYQETMLAFYRNLVNNKYDAKKSRMGTYFVSIGKNKVADYFKSRNVAIDEISDIAFEPYVYPDLTPQQLLLKEKFQQLGKKCQNVIRLFYYRGLSLKDIVELGFYKDENSAKSQKSRCMKQLRTLVKQ
jgi:RNA polymerase sigma-70 factor (ECF subfamily)